MQKNTTGTAIVLESYNPPMVNWMINPQTNELENVTISEKQLRPGCSYPSYTCMMGDYEFTAYELMGKPTKREALNDHLNELEESVESSEEEIRKHKSDMERWHKQISETLCTLNNLPKE